MGSFDYTCCVSGLPISYDDPVRFFLLTKNPYQENDVVCDINDFWTPRTFPLRARYDDNGLIKDLQEGVQQKIWFDCFKKDLIIKGIGDNSYHEVAINHDMNLNQWLNSIYKGRIKVKDLDRDNEDVLPSIGIPTLKRIFILLKENNLRSSVTYKDNGFIIDELEPGTIRVRSNYNDISIAISSLKTAENYLSNQYSTMIRSGTGNYSDVAELIISPKPLFKNGEYYNMRFGNWKLKKELDVSQVMIREDVWQKISNLKFYDWKDDVISKEKYLEYLKLAYNKYIYVIKNKNLNYYNAYLLLLSSDIVDEMKNEKCFEVESKIRIITKDMISFVLGLSTHFDMFCRSKHTNEEAEDFLNVIADFAMINYVLYTIRYYWKPSGMFPQYGKWKDHKKINQIFVEICDQKINKTE